MASTNKLTTFSHAEKYWWQAGYNQGKGRVFFDDRGYDESVGDFVLGIVVPIYDENGQVVGILKSNMKIFSLFSQVINNYSPLYYPGIVKIARTDGLVVLESDRVPLSTRIDDQFIEAISNTPTSHILKGENNQEYLISFSPIINTTDEGSFGFGGNGASIDHFYGNIGENWVAILETPGLILDKLVADQTRQFLLIGFISIFFISLFTLLLVKNATKHIEELVLLTEAVGEGNLDKQIHVSSNDEIGKLARAFNAMILSLKQTMASKEQFEYLSATDELTKLHNRRALNYYLDQLIDYSRHKEPLSIIMIDIDHFKKVNDTYGHNIGDMVLIELANVLLDNVPKTNIISRWGGEEFIILIPKIKGPEAYIMAQDLRQIIEKTKFVKGIDLTVSIGVTELLENDSPYDFIKRVDAAQYEAKSSGRNCVRLF